MVMDTIQYRSMIKKSKPDAPKPLVKGDDIGSVGGLVILAGGSGKIKLSKKITKIGKHPQSDIVVKGLWVGKTAVTISKRSDGFYISYVGGMSKPKINDKSIKHSIILNDLDIIDIGPAKLQYHDLSHNTTRIIKIDKKNDPSVPGAQ